LDEVVPFYAEIVDVGGATEMDDHLVLAPAHEDSPALVFLDGVDIDELIAKVDVLDPLRGQAVEVGELVGVSGGDDGEEDDLL
jgi:hypothetical protein